MIHEDDIRSLAAGQHAIASADAYGLTAAAAPTPAARTAEVEDQAEDGDEAHDFGPAEAEAADGYDDGIPPPDGYPDA